MPLPSAVQKIDDAVKAAEEEARKASQSDQPPLSAVPGTGNQGAQANQDEETWEKRFRGLTTTHQQVKRELENARNTIASNQQMIASLQQQVSQLMQKSQQPAPAADQDRGTPDSGQANDAGFKAYFDRLPQSIKDEYSEDYLRDQYIIQTSAMQHDTRSPDELNELKQQVSRVAQFQDKTAAQLYEEAMDKAYPNDKWIQLASGPDWADFCSRAISPVDPRTYGQVVKAGSDGHDANTVIWVLRQYEQHLSALNQQAGNTGGSDPLSGQLTPDNGNGSGGADPVREINAQAETFRVSEVNQFFKDVATTRKYTPEQAADIENRIKAAQAAGKIIQG